MKERRKITFNIGDENHIVIEKITKNNICNSIFSDPYRFALRALNSYFDSLPHSKSERLKENELWRNNIFAFIGDRGSGKTSCMQSIAQLLTEHSDMGEGNSALKESYHRIDMIDPSFIDNDSNVVGVVLASLYKQFLNYQCLEATKEGLKIEIASHFVSVQHDFYRMMEKKSLHEDNLEALSSLSAAIDLKQSMLRLIDCFLKYIDKEGSVLLIPVDDIDLHTQAACEMVEQIRKYLVLPNVVILMAVKIGQLSKLKRLQFSREYKDDRDTLSDSNLDEMVDRYITKLVPYNHRIYMPDADFYLDADLTIRKEGRVLYHNVSTRQAIPELIFWKTRYLFYNSSVKTSYIVPKNLRELRQLTRLLVDMENYWHVDQYNKKVEEKSNKIVFKKYLFESWMQTHLDVDSQQLIKELLEIKDAIQMNAVALRIIKQKFYEKDDQGALVAPWKNDVGRITDCSELDYIMSRDNMVYNIAIGDVVAVIGHLEKLDITSDQMLFLFLIKTIYSIRLYEYYDEYTAQKDDEDDSASSAANVAGSEVVLKRKLYEDLQIPNYFKLVGGRFFNSRISVSFPRKTGFPSRINRVINLTALNDLMEKCVDYPDRVSEYEVMMAEFFMLCTARSFNSRHYQPDQNIDFYEPAFRSAKQLVYGASLENKNSAIFDVSSFLYNVIEYERCCLRFPIGKKFLELIKNRQDEHTDGFADSIYHRFYLLTETSVRNDEDDIFVEKCRAKKSLAYTSTEKEYSKHEWLSWACLRNVEILTDLISFLDEYEYRGGGSDIKRLLDFFNRMSRYSIHSYDLKGSERDQEYYSINYRFARIMAELLNAVDADSNLSNQFFDIYDGYSAKEYKAKVNSINVSVTAKLDEDAVKGMISGRFMYAQTLVKKLKAKYPKFYKDPYRGILDAILMPEVHNRTITKDQVPELVSAINAEVENIERNHGNAEANNQNLVPTPEE